MDDDDSQDELINRNTSSSKGRRAPLWAISDDSDDAEEESVEGESDSGEEEEGGHLDGDGDEDEEEGSEEDDDEEEEDEAKAGDGALGGTSADLAGMSSDEDTEKCPICLNSFNSQPVATPENCEHYFCLDCILEWAKNANSCPVDRIAFNNIYLRKCYGGKVKKMITVQKPVKEGQEETVDLDLEQTNCEVCGGSDREDRLLLCDGCDAGYHMECLRPPLDAVPVEEWFCPECEANNRHSRRSAEELSDTESLPSTARPATSRSQHATGPTRAIARTQQSERVRANVNRHRITQLAPTYLIQSTWLDETINAVVAGLNTAVYVRDFTPRAPSSRRRKTKKRRTVTKRTTSSAGKNGKVIRKGVKGKRRKVKRRKSRKQLVLKKSATPRSRIANSLGMAKDKKGSSLPTVYRPAEHTLSGMRADIGAASLSIYGDPFDLDPFVDHEEEEQAHVTSLLEAKRRGISRSAMRSHQPVARPVTTSLYRRGADLPQPAAVAEAAPVPDLLGSILSGQSMLLMDSSDVVINRDGSLKASKPVIPSVSKTDCRNSTSGDSTPVMSPTQGVVDASPHYSGELSGSSHTSTSRPFPQSASHIAANMPSSASHIQPSPRSDLPPRGAPGLQPPHPIRSTHPLSQRGTSGVRSPSPFSPAHQTPDSGSKHKGTAPSHSQPKKAPTKPMWVDVSVLPRIPKIKRESSGITSDESNSGNSSSSTGSSNGYRLPGMNSLAGNQGRQQSVDQQKGRNDGQRQRSEAAGPSSSSAFSSSFSSSSSSTSSPAHQLHYSSASSSSSAVSFRINSSGNSWHSRRLSLTSSSSTAGEAQESWEKKEDSDRKRQLHRDKQKLLASRTLASKEEDDNNIYDPFNPTLSDSSGSDDDDDVESKCNSQHATSEEKPPHSRNQERLVRSSQDLVHVKTEIPESEASEEEPRRDRLQETVSQEVRSSEKYIKVEKEESRVAHTATVKHKVLLDTEIKREPESDDAEEAEKDSGCAKRLSSQSADTTASVHHSPHLLKSERETPHEGSLLGVAAPGSAPSNNKKHSSASSSAPDKNEQKQGKTKSDFKSCSKSPPRDSSRKGKTSQGSKEGCSSSSETDRGRRGEYHTSGHGGGEHKDKKYRERNSKRSRSRERRRRRARSASASSRSSSPDRSGRKRRRSRSRSKDRRRSRSGSSSGSRESSWRKKHKQSYGKDRNSERNRTSRDKRRGRSPSKSRSKSRSRSRSRSKENKRRRSCSKSRSRSRSRSRERRKDHRQLHQTSVPSREKAMTSRSKDGGRRRSRSSSRERRTQEGSSSKSSQKPSKASDSCISSHKDTKHLQAKAKEKDTARGPREDKVATVTKQESPPRPVVAKVKKEDEDVPIDNRSTATELANKVKPGKVKKEKRPSLDMFEDSIVTEAVKKEEGEHQAVTVLQGTHSPEQPIKTEPCDIPVVKSEPGSPELCPLPPVTSGSTPTLPATIDGLHEAAPQSPSSPEQPSTVQTSVPVKQEVHQPSDSDDDFNVDMMLDNLDFVKSKGTEGSDAFVKEEKEAEEEKSEAGQPSAVTAVKSKAQVKRVTWNIQEPEGPQPDKSASKVALYKLRLKQEGVRRPSLAAHTSSQDITGSDSSKKAVPDPFSSSSRPDGAHPEGSSTAGQEEGEEGDLSKKDKYLKKLHMQERAIEEVKLAIKPFYQKRDINKDEYKEILRKAVQKVCHSKSGEINPVKVGNLVKAYVDKYKHARKHRKGEDSGKAQEVPTEAVGPSDCM